MKTIDTLTLYDVMAEDLDIWISQDASFGFRLEIEDEKGNELIKQTIHPMAADSFSDFCRRYLAAYDKASQKEAA